MAYGTINADLMTTSDGVSSSGLYGFKNRIINGSMVINQRGWSGTITSDGTYTLDRFEARSSASSKFSVSQNAGSLTGTNLPVGFTNYLGVTSASAYSVSSTDYFAISQVIEGYNIADLNFGFANAKTITLSFQVYSSLTGTFSGALLNDARDRVYPFTYTISSANTWTTISVTIAGDTSGTWVTTNGAGLYVRFCLGAGSTRLATAGSWQTTAGAIFGATGTTSVVGTNGATFYITGVQLEKGSTATSFDYRPYGTELQLCRRYFQQYGLNNDGSGLAPWGPAWSTNGTSLLGMFTFDQQMRTSPTITYSSSADFQWIDYSAASNTAYNLSAISSGRISAGSARIEATASSGTPTTGRGGVFTFNSAGRVFCSSEL